MKDEFDVAIDKVKDTGRTNLASALQAAVPLWVKKIQDRSGSPSAEDFNRASETSDMLGERGDVLLFGAGKKGRQGEVADLFNRTAEAIAILSFSPGGVRIFGMHFESFYKVR